MYCTSCGKELPEDVLFCPYCGSKIKAPGNYYDQSQTNPYYQTKKKGLSPAIIIALCLIVLIFIISIGVAFFIVISYRNSTSTSSNDSGTAGQDSVNDFTSQIADTWEDQGMDMTGKIMYAAPDATTKNENSYWEFLDNKKAKLVFGPEGYFEADYLVLTDKLGMLYTEFKFPEYGLTYDELASVTEARMKENSSCNGYVVIVFTNMVTHNADGSTEKKESPKPVMYYGVSYDTGDSTLYNMVGANSASYYNFICDK